MTPAKKERREAILVEATRYFANHGYEKADMQRLADTLNIGKGTIYRYFPSKKELFYATVDAATVKLNEYIHEQIKNAPDDESKIKTALRAYIDFFKDYPLVAELFVQERAAFRLRENPSYATHSARGKTDWMPVIHRLQAAGKIRPGDPEKIFNTISLLLLGIMFIRGFHYPLASEDLFLSCIDVTLHGIFTQAVV